METIIIAPSKYSTNDVHKLATIYNDLILDTILDKIENTYYTEGDKKIHMYKLEGEICDDLSASDVKDSGIRNIKRLKRYLKKVEKTMSLESINVLFHFVHTKILKGWGKKPRICRPKHDEIQKLRKAYVAKKKEMKIAFDTYRTAKGNFYKLPNV